MSKFFSLLLDSLFPKEQRCILCKSKSPQSICEFCMASLNYLEGVVCLKCGKGLNEAYPEHICPDCKGRSFYFERAFSCFEYTGSGKEMIHSFKYEGKTEVAAVLAKLSAQKIKAEDIKADAIVPVPIHAKKLQTRGFNQTELVGRELAKILNIPLIDCLQRTKETEAQYNLDKNQRLLNVADAFSLRFVYNSNKYKNMILLDDIYTTGSTANTCSKVLKEAGAKCIYVMTAATGSNT